MEGKLQSKQVYLWLVLKALSLQFVWLVTYQFNFLACDECTIEALDSIAEQVNKNADQLENVIDNQGAIYGKLGSVDGKLDVVDVKLDEIVASLFAQRAWFAQLDAKAKKILRNQVFLLHNQNKAFKEILQIYNYHWISYNDELDFKETIKGDTNLNQQFMTLNSFKLISL